MAAISFVLLCIISSFVTADNMGKRSKRNKIVNKIDKIHDKLQRYAIYFSIITFYP